jgi:methylisocitrate lyase
MGFSLPDTAFNMATGGWVTAAANHLKMARELMETGTITSGNWNFPEKYELIDHPLYDGLIEEWAEKTGRQSRPNHAP